MVNYRYKDRFSRDSVYKDLVIVNHAAVVTGVDSAPPSITGANYIITNSDIDGELFKLYENLCSQPNLAFGACEASKVTFTIYSKSIPTLTDEWIDIYLYFEGDSSTLFRIGTYLVNSDKLSADRTKRVITAFDSLREMLNLDITDWYHSFFSGTHGMATIKQMRDSLFDYYTQQEIVCSQENVTLPNDNFVIVKTLKEDIFGSTLLPAICELNGCFGHIDRSGTFKYVFLKDYTDSPDAVIPDSIRKGTTTYEDYRVPSICKLVIYDSNNNVLAKEAVSGRQVYKIHGNPLLNAKKPPEVVNLTKNIYSKLQYKRYTPSKVPAMGNLCIEVGDYIAVEGKDAKFKSYVLSRTFSGVQTLTDTYESKGSRKAPKEKGSGASSAGDYSSSEWAGSDIGGSGGSAGVVGTDLVELIRNFGFRLLNEPQDAVFTYDKDQQKVSITWRDPEDIETDEPAPAKWAGTVVVRKEDSPPIHIWDEGAEVLVDSTTRDEYAEEAFVDSNVPANKRFYYGVFPYDDDGIVKHYRWTKVFSVDTYGPDIKASQITSVTTTARTAEVNYSLIDGSYTYRKVVIKKGSIPRNVDDGIAINVSAGSTKVTADNLDADSVYYCTLFEQSSAGSKAQSNIVEAKTKALDSKILFEIKKGLPFSPEQYSGVSGTAIGASWNADTGEIKTFVTTGAKWWDRPAPHNTPLKYPNADVFVEIDVRMTLQRRSTILFVMSPFRFVPNGLYSPATSQGETADALFESVSYTVSGGYSRATYHTCSNWNKLLQNLSINQYHTYKYQLPVRNGKLAGTIKIWVDGVLAGSYAAPANVDAPRPWGRGNMDVYGNYSDNSYEWTSVFPSTWNPHDGEIYCRHIKVWHEVET